MSKPVRRIPPQSAEASNPNGSFPYADIFVPIYDYVPNAKGELVKTRRQDNFYPIDFAQPHPENPKRGDIPRIAESIVDGGFYGTCIVQLSTNYIIVGNHRRFAAKDLGFTKMRFEFVDVDDATAIKMLIKDNRLADLGKYNQAELVSCLSFLELQSETGLVGSGYSQDELQKEIARLEKMTAQAIDESSGDDEGNVSDERDPSTKSISVAFSVEDMKSLKQQAKIRGRNYTPQQIIVECLKDAGIISGN